MTISFVLLLAMGVMYACGIYLMLERSMTRVLLGFLLVGNATNLLLLLMAGGAGLAPIVTEGVDAADMTDPLPQALILTAIVITFAVSAFMMALIYRSWRLAREDDLEIDEEDIAVARGAVAVSAERTREPTGDPGIDTGPLSLPRELEEREEEQADDAADSGDPGGTAVPPGRGAHS
ncbi:Na(+)/H(+) antiporter subunit C [Lysobacter korlensis]|uniref:Na(+)/H(+) antiporter subunit C n=1 Tax=Lysobacter korlensis TaxID=553636 RepID=A0ABV6RWI5_9GAMM